MSKGKVVSVNISREKGEKKHAVERCRLIKGQGLENDAHAGFIHRQVSLLGKESIRKIESLGICVGAGDFAENLTTEGIDLPALPVGTKLALGEGILLRVTQIGKECHSRCAIFQQVGDCIMPREGIFAEVLTDGEIKPGDPIGIVK